MIQQQQQDDQCDNTNMVPSSSSSSSLIRSKYSESPHHRYDTCGQQERSSSSSSCCAGWKEEPGGGQEMPAGHTFPRKNPSVMSTHKDQDSCSRMISSGYFLPKLHRRDNQIVSSATKSSQRNNVSTTILLPSTTTKQRSMSNLWTMMTAAIRRRRRRRNCCYHDAIANTTGYKYYNPDRNMTILLLFWMVVLFFQQFGGGYPYLVVSGYTMMNQPSPFMAVKKSTTSTPIRLDTIHHRHGRGTTLPSRPAFWSLFQNTAATTAVTNRNDDENNNEEKDDTTTTTADLNDPTVFKAVVQSLQLYQAAFGNLNQLPYDFYVPAMAPWPKPAWKVALGQLQIVNPKQMMILQRLNLDQAVNRSPQRPRTNNNIIQKSTIPPKQEKQQTKEENRQNDYDMEEEDEDVNDSMEDEEEDFADDDDNYDEDDFVKEEPENVWAKDTSFSVTTVDDSSSNQVDRRSNRRMMRKPLESIPPPTEKQSQVVENSNTVVEDTVPLLPPEFDVDPSELPSSDQRFRNVYMALARYKQLYGDLYVPQPFVIPPTKQWPEDLWGLRLGARVNAIRSQGTFVNTSERRRKLLDDLGFVWTQNREDVGRRPGRPPGTEDRLPPPPSNMNQRPSAVSTLESIFGGSVDFGPDYLRSNNNRNKDGDDDGDGETNNEDNSSPSVLNWDLDGVRVPETMGKSGLSSSDLMLNNDYEDERPLDESLKEATERAVACGVIEEMGNHTRVIQKKKRERYIPWYNDDFGDEFVFEDVVEALTIYKEVFGDFSNFTKECDFVVPSPKEATGFLGYENENIPSSSFATGLMDSSSPSSLDYEEYSNGRNLYRDGTSRDSIASEISRLQKEVERESKRGSPVTDLLPDDNYDDTEAWGEHLAGMSLGHIVRRIRDGSLEVKHLPERKAQLDAIGFDWGDPKYFLDIPFEKTICACYAYYLIRGDMFVDDDFIMGSDDPWPQALAGFELGKAVRRIRELQYSFETYHPEKVILLRMIDFLWFTDSVALPLDPLEGELSDEMILLGGYGHPDYHLKVADSRIFEKVLADGPFHDTQGDPRLWWRVYHNYDYVKDYWYEHGRRDNGRFLRDHGYTKMADEHEQKYGPGLYTHIESLMDNIRAFPLEERAVEERNAIVKTLSGFHHEVMGDRINPNTRKEMLLEFEELIFNNINDNETLREELESSGFFKAVEKRKADEEEAKKVVPRDKAKEKAYWEAVKRAMW